MNHLSLKQLSLYHLTTLFEIKAVNLNSGEIKVIKDIVYLEYSTKYLKYLMFLNTKGFNIYFFPARKGGGCVDFLLDDLTEVGIDGLFRDGLKPLYYLETSPGNCQAILRFNASISDKVEYLAVNRHLVEKYNADPNSIGTEHFFRLSGFTNRKAKYLKNSLYPFIKLFVFGNTLDESLLPKVKSSKKTPTAPRQLRWQGKKEKNGRCDNFISAIYRAGGISDISRLDWKVVRIALQKGFSEIEIAAAIRKYSPNLEARKAGHVEDYLLRTIRNAALNLN